MAGERTNGAILADAMREAAAVNRRAAKALRVAADGTLRVTAILTTSIPEADRPDVDYESASLSATLHELADGADAEADAIENMAEAVGDLCLDRYRPAYLPHEMN